MATDRTLRRAEDQIVAGRAWRAKEILKGALASSADARLLERYGRLLDAMGDRYEAGKYLFLSGARLPEYADAIEIFLARNVNRSEADFVSQFPSSVRRLRFADLPPVVQDALRQRGVPENRFAATARAVPTSRYTGRDRLTMVAGVLIMIVFFLALGLGLRVMVNWLISFWRG